MVPLFWIPGLVPPLRWFLRGLRTAWHPKPPGTLRGCPASLPVLLIPSGWLGQRGGRDPVQVGTCTQQGSPGYKCGSAWTMPTSFLLPPRSPPTVIYSPWPRGEPALCHVYILCLFSFRGGRAWFFTERGGTPMAALMWNRSPCPGCRLFNKQIGTTQCEVCEGL